MTMRPGRGSEEDAGEAPLSPRAASSEGAESSENGGTSFMYVRAGWIFLLDFLLQTDFIYSLVRARDRHRYSYKAANMVPAQGEAPGMH